MRLGRWTNVAVLSCMLALVACAEETGSDSDDDGGGAAGASGGNGGHGGTGGGGASTSSSTTTSGSSMLVDECSQGLDNCDPNATCTDLVDGFECACNEGYSGDGVTCTDDDECSQGLDNCDPNATCTNTPGSFECECNVGYSGDGVTCTDDDECAAMTDNCSVDATCANTEGGFTCTCNVGYSGDGVTCTDDDECAAMTHNCDANATCTNTPGSFTCACAAGYSGDGLTCTDDDECAAMTDNCDANATCTNTPGSFTCTCNPPYVGNGVSCTIPPPGDSCGVAKVIGALPYIDTDDSSLYSDNHATGGGCANDGGDFGLGAEDVVYVFTPTATGTYGIAIDKSGNSGPSLFYITTDCADIANTCVADSGDTWGVTEASFSFQLTMGVTYYIVVDGWYESEAGPYTLELRASEPEVCTDGVDNDFNGDVDCDDAACAAHPYCERVESIVGCDSTYCTFAAGAGPNGGDLCSCTFQGKNHPATNDLTMTSACMYFEDGLDMVMSFDMTSYTGFSVTTCNTPGDSSLGVYDADPMTMPPELYCSDDAAGEASYCSEIGDSGGLGAPTATAKPPGNTLWILVDEYSSGGYWDNATTRTIDIELIP